MGILGGMLLLVGVILFFLGFVPIALFIGGIGVLFAVMAGGNGAAKGFGGGCLVIVAILGVGGYFLYNVITADGDSAEPSLGSLAKTSKHSGKRKYIKEFIDEQDGCRIAAITEKGGDVAICGQAGYCCTPSCPSGLKNSLKEINGTGVRITDVCLTDAGRYVVLFGKNGFFTSADIPRSMYDALERFKTNNEALLHAAHNDSGEWVVVSDKHYIASKALMDWLNDGVQEFGYVKYVALTDTGKIASFEKGVKASGIYSTVLWEAMRVANFDIKVIKMAGDSWFFVSSKGGYSYSM